jgi:hypothetical protein
MSESAGSHIPGNNSPPGPAGVLSGTAAPVKAAATVVAVLACLLGALGGVGSFATVRHLATPWFGSEAWIVPVGIDVGILALLAWDLLAEYVRLPWPVLRWTAWAFVAATTYLNIAAAHGAAAAAVMHAAMPILFVTVVEGVRHLIRQWAGLAAGTRIERIPAARWLLAPRSTTLIARRMVLWHITSYRDGLALEYQRLHAVARLQRTYGRWLWRWRAPLEIRLALRLLPVTGDTPGTLTGASGRSPSPRDEQLIQAASAVLADAHNRGQTISQAALGRMLRADGHTVGNDRLRWLTAQAQDRTSAIESPERRAA